MKLKDSSHPYALLTVVLWSVAHVFTRMAMRYFSPFAFGLLRYGIASLALIIIAVVAKLKPPRREDWKWFALAGACGFFFYMMAFNIANQTLPAATGSMILATAPILTAVFANFLSKERLAPLQWIAILVAFLGVAAMTVLGGGLSVNKGILWMMAAAILLSGYNILQRRLTKTYSALQASTYSIFFGTIMLLVFLPDAVREARSAPAIQWFYILVLSIGSSAIAYASWATAFSKAKDTSSVSNYMFLTPLLSSLFARVVADERLELPTILGGLLIFAGLLLFYFGNRLLAKLRGMRTGGKEDGNPPVNE